MLRRFFASDEWKFFGVLFRASRPLTITWWALIVLRGALPAVFAIAMGVLIGAVNDGTSLVVPLIVMGAVFILLQTLNPLHLAVSANLGSRTSTLLSDWLTRTCVDPPGIAHLERADLTADLTMARDFDLGISGPPLSISMDFIAVGLVELATGVAAAIVLAGYTWWAPLLLVAGWLSTHVLLRESTVWRDRQTDEVLEAQRHADYTYRLAVDPPAAKEIRLFGLSRWTVDRFAARRRRLFDLQWQATRLRERPVIWCFLIIVTTNGLVFWALAHDALVGNVSLSAAIVFAQTAVGTSMLGVAGFSWAHATASQPVGAVMRLEPAMAAAGALDPRQRFARGHARPGDSLRRCHLCLSRDGGEGARRL